MKTKIARPSVVITALISLAAFSPVWAGAQAKTDPKRNGLPAAVVKALDANCPGAEIDKLDIEKEHGIRVYDFEFKAGRGEMDVAEDGTVLDVATVIELKDVPEPAATVIRKAAGERGVRQVEKSEIRSRIEMKDGKGQLVQVAPPEFEYEAELAKGGEIEVAADGKVIKGPKSLGKESPEKK